MKIRLIIVFSESWATPSIGGCCGRKRYKSASIGDPTRFICSHCITGLLHNGQPCGRHNYAAQSVRINLCKLGTMGDFQLHRFKDIIFDTPIR